MRRLQNQPKKLGLNQAEQMIRDTETPEHSFSEQIINRIEGMKQRPDKPRFFKKLGITTAVSAAALAAIMLVGGFLSPVMAETMEKIPLLNHIILFVNELGAKSADSGEKVFFDDKGKVAHLAQDLSYAEIEDEDFRNQLTAAWNEIFPGDSNNLKDLNIWYSENYSVLRAGDETKTIYIINGELDFAVQKIQANEVPDSVKTIADRIFKSMGNFKNSSSIVEMTLRPKQQPPIYNFVYDTGDGEVWIDIEQETNRITRVFADPLSDQLYKASSLEGDLSISTKTKALETNELVKTAVEQAREWMNLDLSDYRAKRDHARIDKLVFTKEGAPDVTAMFNSQGSFYYFMIQGIPTSKQ
ncbi:hypothetical protein [Paenibacillus macerans]|uniref:DUF4179 domain-containing protein n=1 Tax=Paenibacillus macerans TaxID=44252 RepID=A0A090Y3V3_PAEMA|nr:hypothetical protein [Paenibacillus macerans]KFM93079.1 hypothetical protein DJ90_2875 [Paenibacillus macerans]MCY7561424.1 hypothetical protein [Paenibacillus macerans]MEC0149464.1 hypothetical protein [Paenibacillus macerans]SUA84730.1 Uncharacterised protein [Paenibacillus macerans]